MPAVNKENTIDVGPLLGPGRRTIAVDASINVPAFDDLRFAGPAHVVLELLGADRGIRIVGTIDAQASRNVVAASRTSRYHYISTSTSGSLPARKRTR